MEEENAIINAESKKEKVIEKNNIKIKQNKN